MAKRLFMTNADYLAIAVSPVLIMALVGSLVFFLIEVMYVGQYEARLDYAFALFVFAAVLIARISIEMGSERAALFALPLGIAMFLFLMKFVEHPSAFSHVINLALLAIVWWCAHKLTWDSTVIDDDEDASGHGLMQRIGVDGPEREGRAEPKQVSDNELVDGASAEGSAARPWWSRLAGARSGPHSPGLWVLYFSLAALPLFGIGQHWIPAADVGRRRYVFFLLLVYVASALALLVSTSFLNLRRYLRQRRVEMPAPIAGTWVGVGAALIVVVMLLAMLIPRPDAEIALSRPPWQAGSPDGLSASRTSVLRDGGEQQGEQEGVAGEATDEEGMKSDRPQDGEQSSATGESGDSQSGSGTKPGDNTSGSSDKSQVGKNGEQTGSEAGSSSDGTPQDGKQSSGDRGERASNDEKGSQTDSSDEGEKQNESRKPASGVRPPGMQSHPMEAVQNVSTALGGLAGLLKILLYIGIAILLAFLIWKYRRELVQALADIWRQLLQLFSGSRTDAAAGQSEAESAGPQPRKFTDFRDPFQSGQHGQFPPEELVRYTFAAFEAWSNDRGRPRTPDCTPQELLGVAVEPATPIYAEARRLVRLYSEVAYASRQVPREAAGELAELWRMMRTTYANDLAAPR